MNRERFKALFPRASEDTLNANTNEERVCIGCGNTFTLNRRSPKDMKYCSQACAASSIGKRTMKENRRIVPKTKFVEKVCPTCGSVFSSWKSNERKYCSSQCSADDPESKIARIITTTANGSRFTYSRSQKQWVELGERRFFARSKWEAYYGIFLEWERKNGRIKDWKYEGKRFWFSGIKRGTLSYLPDFEVTENDGSTTYREVKGWMDPKSKTRLKRMKKYYPLAQVDVIDKTWFKNNKVLLSIITLEHFREDVSR